MAAVNSLIYVTYLICKCVKVTRPALSRAAVRIVRNKKTLLMNFTRTVHFVVFANFAAC